MIKLRIEATTGRILGAYPEAYEVPKPFVKVTEEQNSEMSADSENVYFYKNKAFVAVPKAEIEAKEKRKAELEAALVALDNKRIRAVCEPSVKDEKTGETWLDYYNAEIAVLRAEYASL